MKDNEVWDLVDLPPNGKTASSKWLFKKTTNMDGAVHTFKARLVAKYFTQIYGVNYKETFSPVVDIRAIRILIAIVAFYDYEILQIDVKTAFLNVHLSQEVYTVQPEGFVNLKFLNQEKLHIFLELRSTKNRSRRLIGLCQIAYIVKILKRYFMENSKCGTIPMQEKLKLSNSQDDSTPAEKQRMQNVPYASVVGSSMYAVRCTRLDIAFAQNITSRFNIIQIMDADDLKSQTGYVFILNGGAIDWKSTKTHKMYCDNTGAIAIAKEMESPKTVESSKELWNSLKAKYMAEDVSNSDKPKGNNVAGPSVVNMVEHNNSSKYNDTRAEPNKKAKPTCWKCGKTGHIKRDCKCVNVGNKANGLGTKGSVDGSSNSLKGQNMFNKSLQVSYVTYVSEAYIVQDDDVAWWVDLGAKVHFDLCDLHATPSLRNKKYFVTFIDDASRDAIFDENRFSSVPRLSLRIPNGTKYIGGSVVPKEVTEETAFLNGELDEEVYMNQPQGFIMPGNANKVNLIKKFLSLRFSMKDMGEADVILVGKLSRYTSNPVLECYTDAKWINNSEDNSSTSGWVFLLGGGVISWVSKKQTCITGSTIKFEFMDLAAAAPISICCEIAATLAKAYSQMYNGKSRHLGVRHIMIRKLIMNGVISIEFMRSQQNLVDYLTKGLARDLVIKSAEGMGLKSNQVSKC
nr:zinc finger, CCHC-type [Tanacetum cinerariifolium]